MDGDTTLGCWRTRRRKDDSAREWMQGAPATILLFVCTHNAANGHRWRRASRHQMSFWQQPSSWVLTRRSACALRTHPVGSWWVAVASTTACARPLHTRLLPGVIEPVNRMAAPAQGSQSTCSYLYPPPAYEVHNCMLVLFPALLPTGCCRSWHESGCCAVHCWLTRRGVPSDGGSSRQRRQQHNRRCGLRTQTV